MNVFGTVAVLFLIVLAGVLARGLNILRDEVIHGISSLVTTITLPCLMLRSMQRPYSDQVLYGFLVTLALSLALTVLCTCGGWLLFARRARPRRAVLASFCGFTNCGFMGYPVIEAINPDWMIYAVAFNVAFNLVAWTLAVSLFDGRQKGSLRKALLNPNILCAVLGFTLFCLHWEWPALIAEGLDRIGSLTTPLSMIIIGARICGIRPGELKDWDYHIITLLRNAVLPLLIWSILRVLPLDSAVRNVLFILSAMPLSSVIAMISEVHHGDAQFAARAVGWSTLLSLGTIPLMALLISA